MGGFVRACALNVILNRLVHISEFRLSAAVNMYSLSFFHILRRALPRSVALSGWLTKPTGWLSERVKISTIHTRLINLKLRENDY